MKDIILKIAEMAQEALELDGKTFQIHLLPESRILLYPVTIKQPDYHRCPVTIKGEQCGEEAGHEGKHCWGGGT